MIPGAHLATAEGCRALDAALIDGCGVPGVALMEVASRGVALAVIRRFEPEARAGVLVVCGSGNNGGDGWGAARWLHLRGFPVSVWSLGEPRGDAAIHRAAAIRAGVPQVDGPRPCGVVLDAVFGTGLSREVTGPAADAIRAVGALDAVKVAVDLPSGLHADTGRALGPVSAARLTVTFGRLKPAFFTSIGGALCGEVELVDIGVDATAHSAGQIADPAALAGLWPARSAWAFKGRLGHLGVVAGTERMAGAAVLCCLGALRAGIGLVTLFTVPEAVPRLAGLPASVMVRAGGLVDGLGEASALSAVAVGPGIGGGKPLDPGVRAAIADWARTGVGVLDADGLFAGGPVGDGIVRTPHPGEAGRILGRSAADVEADRFGAARALGAQGGVSLLKGRFTLVADGERLSVNPSGASTLGVAGSGDVLTGVIGALRARGLSAWDAARVGAWVHGRAGERLAAQRPEGWSAEDIAAAIPGAVEDLRAPRG